VVSEGPVVAGGSVSDVRAIVVTHTCHDHCGVAGAEYELSEPVIGPHSADVVSLKTRYGVTHGAATVHVLTDSGVPEGTLPGATFAASCLLLELLHRIQREGSHSARLSVVQS
jgi:glyoxylase-like metal-dependent hydrolase (beta-lactamase superfamily II)